MLNRLLLETTIFGRNSILEKEGMYVHQYYTRDSFPTRAFVRAPLLSCIELSSYIRDFDWK